MHQKYRLSLVFFNTFALIFEVLIFTLLGLFWIEQEKILTFLNLKPSFFRFATPEYLKYLPWTFCIFLLFLIDLLWRNQAMKKLANFSNLSFRTQAFSNTAFILKYVCTRLGFLFLLLALARPQYGLKTTPIQVEGFEMLVALDVSKSMEAVDKDENFSRITRAKMALQNQLTKWKGNRLGIIVFAGEAYMFLPLTSDYHAAKQFIENINTEMVSSGGTYLGAAIDLALESFDFTANSQKILLLISDGEDHESGLETFLEAAKEKNIIIHTIGIGSVEGTPIPDLQYGQMKGYKKDPQGNIIISKLNENVLQEIADKTGGTYTRASNSQLGLENLMNALLQTPKEQMQTVDFIDYENYYPIFVYLCLFFWSLELFLFVQKPKWRKENF